MLASPRLSLRLALLCLMVSGPPPDHATAAGKPSLSLKGSPATGTRSTVFVFRAELKGGEDSEDLYCLTSEWIWEEQADSSLNETECPPYVPGETKIDRSFTEEQSFRRSGTHLVEVILRKRERVIASARTTVRVREVP